MADFHQTGAITTLHRLGAPRPRRASRASCRSYATPGRSRWCCPACSPSSATPRSRGSSRTLRGVRVPAPGGRQPLGHRPARGLRGDAGGLRRASRTLDGAPRDPALERRAARRSALRAARAPRVSTRARSGKGRATWLAYGYVLADQRVARDRGPRLRHPRLRPRAARAALLPDREPEPQLRVREGLLRPRHRPPLRARHAAVRDAAAARDEVGARAPRRCSTTSTPSATRWRASAR